MEIIFICTDKKKIKEVYSEKILSEISIFNIDNFIFTKQELESNPKITNDVKYIFSTWNMPEFSEDEIDKIFPNLKAVFYAAGTVKYFARPFLNKGIKVYSASIANGVPVAEFTVAQIILANKGYFQAMLKYRSFSSVFSYKKIRNISGEKSGNYNSIVGIIGGGAIGRKVVELLKAYDMKVYVSDPYISEEEISTWGANKVSLETIFKECDVISNHLPDNAETQNMIDYSILSLMKFNATFINTGRGRQVVDKDLAKVMKEKPCACALLDVTRHEPLFPGHVLKRRKNIFISPHIAGSMKNENQRLAEMMIKAYGDLLSNKDNMCEVTIEKLKRMA